MTLFFFTGPSLPHEEALALLGSAEKRLCPPVGRGDVLRALQQEADAIAIVDGVFGSEASVTHKEILWALHSGVPVFGAASMGALRASELDCYGMVGCGRIYENFRDGVVWDDDEVAVLHGPAEVGFIPLTEPLANIRATLRKGLEESAISEAAYTAVMRTAVELFYAERTWEQVLCRVLADDSASHLQGELDWLDHNRVDQKRLDAIQLCSLLATPGSVCRRPQEFTFVATDPFEVLRVTATNPFLEGSLGYRRS